MSLSVCQCKDTDGRVFGSISGVPADPCRAQQGHVGDPFGEPSMTFAGTSSAQTAPSACSEPQAHLGRDHLTNMSAKVGVVGAGSVGKTLGGQLLRAGFSVKYGAHWVQFSAWVLPPWGARPCQQVPPSLRHPFLCRLA